MGQWVILSQNKALFHNEPLELKPKPIRAEI